MMLKMKFAVVMLAVLLPSTVLLSEVPDADAAAADAAERSVSSEGVHDDVDGASATPPIENSSGSTQPAENRTGGDLSDNAPKRSGKSFTYNLVKKNRVPDEVTVVTSHLNIAPGSSKSGKEHIGPEGIPVIEGVRRPDNKSDGGTYRNAKVINGQLVSRKSKSGRILNFPADGGGESFPYSVFPSGGANLASTGHHQLLNQIPETSKNPYQGIPASEFQAYGGVQQQPQPPHLNVQQQPQPPLLNVQQQPQRPLLNHRPVHTHAFPVNRGPSSYPQGSYRPSAFPPETSQHQQQQYLYYPGGGANRVGGGPPLPLLAYPHLVDPHRQIPNYNVPFDGADSGEFDDYEQEDSFVKKLYKGFVKSNEALREVVNPVVEPFVEAGKKVTSSIGKVFQPKDINRQDVVAPAVLGGSLALAAVGLSSLAAAAYSTGGFKNLTLPGLRNFNFSQLQLPLRVSGISKRSLEGIDDLSERIIDAVARNENEKTFLRMFNRVVARVACPQRLACNLISALPRSLVDDVDEDMPIILHRLGIDLRTYEVMRDSIDEAVRTRTCRKMPCYLRAEEPPAAASKKYALDT